MKGKELECNFDARRVKRVRKRKPAKDLDGSGVVRVRKPAQVVGVKENSGEQRCERGPSEECEGHDGGPDGKQTQPMLAEIGYYVNR
jgi:hypothetical protein